MPAGSTRLGRAGCEAAGLHRALRRKEGEHRVQALAAVVFAEICWARSCAAPSWCVALALSPAWSPVLSKGNRSPLSHRASRRESGAQLRKEGRHGHRQTGQHFPL